MFINFLKRDLERIKNNMKPMIKLGIITKKKIKIEIKIAFEAIFDIISMWIMNEIITAKKIIPK